MAFLSSVHARAFCLVNFCLLFCYRSQPDELYSLLLETAAICSIPWCVKYKESKGRKHIDLSLVLVFMELVYLPVAFNGV